MASAFLLFNIHALIKSSRNIQLCLLSLYLISFLLNIFKKNMEGVSNSYVLYIGGKLKEQCR